MSAIPQGPLMSQASAAGLEVRSAVRASLSDLPAGSVVLVACSGGADSMALAAAAAFVGPREGFRVGAVTVDHGIQEGSAARARAVAATLVRLGLDPVESWHGGVTSGGETSDATGDGETGGGTSGGGPKGSGPEGDARALRFRLLEDAAQRHGAAAVLLGHTRDDQAETVLLGLARGSGARSLAGMRPVIGRIRRPLVELSRERVREAVPSAVDVWEDPHNADVTYARARVRHRVLPVLEAELGPGIAAALARTADLLRADADALDAAAEDVWPLAVERPDEFRSPIVIRLDVLDPLPFAVVSRILRRAAITAGAPPTDLTAGHLSAVAAAMASGRGGTGVDLPGKVRATCRGDRVTFTTAAGQPG